MKEILILECVYGYDFELINNEISYQHIEGTVPDKEDVLPLFETIQAQKKEAIKYLENRSQPVDVGEHIWRAAEKAQSSAVQAENHGKLDLANKEWQRSIRLFAGAAKAWGVVDPLIPWDRWIADFVEKINTLNGNGEDLCNECSSNQ